MRRRFLATLTVGLALLAGCSGGGGGSPTPKWEVLAPDGGEFQIRMPGPAKSETVDMPVPGRGPVPGHIYSFGERNGVYAVGWADYPAGVGYDYGAGVRGFAAQHNGQVLSSKSITVNGHSGVEFSISVSKPHSGSAAGRLLSINRGSGNRLYMLFAIGNDISPSHATAREFFDSFQITAPDPRVPVLQGGPPNNLPAQQPPVVKPPPSPKGATDWQVTALPLPPGGAAPGMCWADDDKHVYLAGKTSGTLQMISVPDGRTVKSLTLAGPCAWMSTSAEGLLLTLPTTQAVGIVDPNNLTLTKTIAVPTVKRVVSAPGLSVAFAELGAIAPAGLAIVDLKTGLAPPFTAGGRAARELFYAPLVSPAGNYLFTRTRVGELMRTRIAVNGLFKDELSGRLSDGRVADICLSPDGKHVALPSGGGNPGGKLYCTHVYMATNLAQPVCVLEQGAYPEVVAFDPAAELIYTQNVKHHLLVFNYSGVKLREYSLGRNAGVVRGYLVHPEGRKLLILTDRQLVWVELPATLGS